jgi:hypothetical protein
MTLERGLNALHGPIGKIVLIAATAVSMSSAAFAASADLIVVRSRVAKSIEIQERTFAASDCAVIERCVDRAGTRKLLMFDAAIANIGGAHLVIGDPAERPGLFHFSECHDHYHMSEFSAYKILNRKGQVVLNKRKQGFCLRDDVKYFGTAGPGRNFTCEHQGISKGWQDVYDKSLDCQWVDITNLRPGRYQLQVTVNPKRLLREGNYGNNTVTVPFRIL